MSVVFHCPSSLAQRNVLLGRQCHVFRLDFGQISSPSIVHCNPNSYDADGVVSNGVYTRCGMAIYWFVVRHLSMSVFLIMTFPGIFFSNAGCSGCIPAILAYVRKSNTPRCNYLYGSLTYRSRLQTMSSLILSEQ